MGLRCHSTTEREIHLSPRRELTRLPASYLPVRLPAAPLRRLGDQFSVVGQHGSIPSIDASCSGGRRAKSSLLAEDDHVREFQTKPTDALARAVFKAAVHHSRSSISAPAFASSSDSPASTSPPL